MSRTEVDLKNLIGADLNALSGSLQSLSSNLPKILDQMTNNMSKEDAEKFHKHLQDNDIIKKATDGVNEFINITKDVHKF